MVKKTSNIPTHVTYIVLIVLLLAVIFIGSCIGKNYVKEVQDDAGNHQCDAWNGVCSNLIEDECCDYVTIRECSGQVVVNPMECFSKYCYDENKFCDANWNMLAGTYTCGCKDIDGQPVACGAP